MVACLPLASTIQVSPDFRVQRSALLITFTAMCQTFYEKHEKCTCIFVQADFAPCAAYSHAHPEVLFEGCDPFADTKRYSTDVDPFVDPQDVFTDPVLETTLVGKAARPKLLTRICQGLDLAYHDTDFVSIDINELRAPKGLHCSEVTTSRLVHRQKGEIVACRLCDRPDVMEKVESIIEWQEEGRRKELEKSKTKTQDKEKERGNGFLHKTAKLGTTTIESLKGAVNGKSKRKNDSKSYRAVRCESPALRQRSLKHIDDGSLDGDV